MSGIQQGFMSFRGPGVATGQQAYTTPGSYSWVVPTGVTSVSVVAVGAGASGARKFYCSGCFCYAGSSGPGGSLSYKNNYSVTPGTSITVAAGTGGAANSSSIDPNPGLGSWFANYSGVLLAKGGNCINYGPNVGDVSYTGGGGNGCTSVSRGGGGGGAGGYTGTGGNGAAGACSGSGSSGGGGGGGASGCGNGGGGGGGGTGILGAGSNGARGSNYAGGGGGGSGGASGSSGSSFNGGNGGGYGGGAGSSSASGVSRTSGAGANGAVRIIWPGTTRSFPSTNTGDM